ncbi:N-acyl homoserine lactonase family protein [Candidatus Bathyarchaeota archaeon]|nr:MAG: N-acyl homoserine lactonase family protein [Candidatus Bathyarchaeota archaeon]
MGYIIRPLTIAKIHASKGIFTYLIDYDKEIVVPCNLWYIEGPKEKIIVDTGCSAEGIKRHGFMAEDIQSIEEALNKVNLKPEDVNIVLVTHLHFDHIGYAYKFPNAKFIVQEDELKYAFSPHIAYSTPFEKGMFINLRLYPVRGDQTITEGVRVLHTPGHTPGGQSIAVDTDKGTAIITGFCSIMDNFKPPKELHGVFPVLMPGIHYDLFKLYDSIMRVKGLADIIVPLHDPKIATKTKIP